MGKSEPRLAKKLITPIGNMIKSTSAISLMYECVQTIVESGMLSIAKAYESESKSEESLASLCVQKLRMLIDDKDSNRIFIEI